MNTTARPPTRSPGRSLAACLVSLAVAATTGCNSSIDLRGPDGRVRVDAGRGGARVDIRGPGGSLLVNGGRGGAQVRVRSNGRTYRGSSGLGRTPMIPPGISVPGGLSLPPGVKLTPELLDDPMVKSALTPAQLAALGKQMEANGGFLPPVAKKPASPPLPPAGAPPTQGAASGGAPAPDQLAGLPPNMQGPVMTLTDPDFPLDNEDALSNPGALPEPAEEIPNASGPDSPVPPSGTPDDGGDGGAGSSNPRDVLPPEELTEVGAPGYDDLPFAFDPR